MPLSQSQFSCLCHTWIACSQISPSNTTAPSDVTAAIGFLRQFKWHQASLSYLAFRVVRDQGVELECHIVLHPVYHVPTLFIDAKQLDGTPCTYEETLSALSEPYRMLQMDMEHRRQMTNLLLTQVEHPVLGMPCYMVHPCQTADWLEGLQGAGDSKGLVVSLPPGVPSCEASHHADTSDNILLQWFTVVGKIVGLELEPSEFECTERLLCAMQLASHPR